MKFFSAVKADPTASHPEGVIRIRQYIDLFLS
jgi:hypothetical protein